MRIANVTSTVTLEGYHAVPAADAVANALMRDVVGNKTDTAAWNMNSLVTSIMAFQKGLIYLHRTAAADGAADGYLMEVLGRKTDTAQESVTDIASAMRYMKAVIQELHQRSVPHTVRGSVAAAVLADVVNITDKGVLTGIYQSSQGADIGLLVVTIDGTIIRAVSEFVYNSQSAALAFNHRFNTSLRVQHRNNAGAVTIRTEVAYTTD